MKIVKKTILFFICVFCLSTLISCNVAPARSSDVGEQNEQTKVTENETGNKEVDCENEIQILESVENCTVVFMDSSYYCFFFNDAREVIRVEGPIYKEPKIEITEDNFVLLTIQAGAGQSTRWGVFYDSQKELFSDWYYGILDQKNGMVVYALPNGVAVKELFNDEGYYREFCDFGEELSAAIEPILEAEINDGGKTLNVVYLAGSDYHIENKVFALEEKAEWSCGEPTVTRCWQAIATREGI